MKRGKLEACALGVCHGTVCRTVLIKTAAWERDVTVQRIITRNGNRMEDMASKLFEPPTCESPPREQLSPFFRTCYPGLFPSV